VLPARADWGQEEAAPEELAAGVLVEPPLLEADEPFVEPVEELDEPADDSDFAGLLAVLVAVSEPDERESVR
jgi:hypothetical protein